MKRRTFVLAFCAACVAIPVSAADTKSIELFGVTLKGASRDQLRKTFKQNSLKATREDDDYWVDKYNAQGVLDGASELAAGYVNASRTFAFAEYTFPAFMDSQLVGKIINMVAIKYGRPSSQNGNYELGSVNARWNVGQGMQIEVSRGWPDTTTYLRFSDTAAYSLMNAEINTEKKSQEQQKAKAQSKAF